MQAVGRVDARIVSIDHHAAAARPDRFSDQLPEQARGPIDPHRVLQIGQFGIGDLHRHARDIERLGRFERDDRQCRTLRALGRHARGRGGTGGQRQQAVGRIAAKADAAAQQQRAGDEER